MKILRISLRNIASLAGEHTVDFTRAPLATAGLFSISGPTGSGKSTLLDALCLALYNQTPRMAVAVGTQAVEDAGTEVQQNDVRNLLRRGCGTGFAEVAFVGVDGETYTARWEVRRARETAGGRLQKTEHSLLKGNPAPGGEGVAAAGGTATEVRDKIVEKLGLSFDQFRRAVLLAQGDFATFLKARDKERAEILQALTGTERFENISKAVFLRNKREQELVNELRNQIGAALPMDAEARAAADEALRNALELHQQIERSRANRSKQLEWFDAHTGHQQKLEEASREVARLDTQVQANAPRALHLGWIRTASIEAGPMRLAEKQAHHSLAEAVRREADLKQLDGTLAAAVDAAEARHKSAGENLRQVLSRQHQIDMELAKARVLDGELAQIEKAAALAQREHDAATRALKNSEDALHALQVQLETLSGRKHSLRQRLSKVAPLAPFAKDLEVWLERFKTEKKARLKKEQLETRVRKAERDAAEAASQLGKVSGTLPSLREKHALSEAAWQTASERAADFKPEEILAHRRNALELQGALQKARAHLADQRRLQTDHKQSAASLDTVRRQIEAENARLEELSGKLIPGAFSILTQTRESLRLAEAAASEHATILRDTLVRGEACPVCGSREHPVADAGATTQNAVLGALRRDTLEKEEALQKLQTALAASHARIDEKKGRERDLAGELVRLESRLEEAERFAPESMEVMALFRRPAPQRDAALTALETQTAELLGSLEKADAERIEAEKQAKNLRAVLDRAARELGAAERVEADFRNKHTAALSDHSNALSELNTLRSEHAVALEAVFPVVSAFGAGGVDFQPPHAPVPERGYDEDPEGFVDWFAAGSKEHLAAAQLLEATGQEEAATLPQRQTMQAAVEGARGTLAARAAELAGVDANLSAKREARATLLGGQPVETAEAEGAAALQAAKAAEGLSAGECVEAAKKLSTHRGLLQDQQTRIVSLEKALHAAGSVMELWMEAFAERENYGIDRVQLDEWLGRDAQWIAGEQQVLDSATQQLAAARGMEAGMHRQLQEHLRAKTTEEDHETVKAAVDSLAREARAAGEAVDVKRAAVLNDEDRRRKTGELSRSLEALEKQAEPWSKLNELIGSSDGTRFRNIAQQWTLEILLRHANAQLARLSGRYRLERLRDSLNLLVTDLEMDGQQRSVHSLSGGESFLVSLGLALGLASMTSSRLLIESLFIDEGFGSLDSETLRVALNALNHLESQGRKVGVISHVSEMVDAIPVQIRVVRCPGGASKIVV